MPWTYCGLSLCGFQTRSVCRLSLGIWAGRKTASCPQRGWTSSTTWTSRCPTTSSTPHTTRTSQVNVTQTSRLTKHARNSMAQVRCCYLSILPTVTELDGSLSASFQKSWPFFNQQQFHVGIIFFPSRIAEGNVQLLMDKSLADSASYYSAEEDTIMSTSCSLTSQSLLFKSRCTISSELWRWVWLKRSSSMKLLTKW